MTNTDILNVEAPSSEVTGEPLFVSPVRTHSTFGRNIGPISDISKGEEISLEILDREGTGQVRITGDGFEDFLIPARYLSILESNSKNLGHMMETESDNLRYNFFEGFTKFGLSLWVRPADVKATTSDKYPERTYVLPGADLNREGTPAIRWDKGRNAAAKAGWVLYMTGAEHVNLGFAKWDDEAGFRSLVESMGDAENLMALGSLMNESIFASLSAKLIARDLRAARQLPGINMAKVKDVIETKNLSSSVFNVKPRSYANAKMMVVKSGKTVVPIAVYLQAPEKLSTPITAEETAKLGGVRSKEYNDLYNERLGKFGALWAAKVQAGFEESGWRVVSLPQTRGRSYARQGQDRPTWLWVTRLNEETWDKVAASAHAIAGTLDMNRVTEF